MGQIVALDSMIFIYLFEADERFFTQVSELFDGIESEKNKAVTSIISVAETLSPEKYKDRSDLLTEISGFFRETNGLTVVLVDWEIGQKAAELRRENKGLRTPDAIQIATAMVSGAEIFITNDLKLRKMKTKIGGIKIVGMDEKTW